MMEEHNEGKTWTFEYLDEFLFAPRTVIPGTAMTFAGLKRTDERTNVIAYLRTLSNSPVPLPEMPTAAAPAEAPEAADGAEHPAPPAAEPPAAVQVPAGEPLLPTPGEAAPETPAE
jgi:cytochrome c